VSGVEKLRVAQPTQRAARFVRSQNSRAKDRLVEPDFGQALNISARVLTQRGAGLHEPLTLVYSDHKLQIERFVGHDPYRVAR
jgi:hypothetical protein